MAVLAELGTAQYALGRLHSMDRASEQRRPPRTGAANCRRRHGVDFLPTMEPRRRLVFRLRPIRLVESLPGARRPDRTRHPDRRRAWRGAMGTWLCNLRFSGPR